MSAVRFLVRMGALLVLFHGVAAASPRRIAEAQEPAARVTQLNREALAAVDKREFEKAREILKKALELCGASGLDRHPVAARTHVHMGVVIIEGFKNRELGEKQFAQALAIEPGIAMTPALVTPEITEAFDEAKEQSKNAGAASAASGGDETAPPGTAAGESAARPSSSGGFTYHTVSEVKRGNAIRVTVNVDETLKFRKVVLAYRPQGTSEFLGREMDPIGPGAYSAEIPEHATTGSSVAYYIEAQDDDGQPVANRGTESRPLVIQLAGEARSSERAHASAVTKRSEDERSDDDDSTTIREEGESQDDNSARWFAGVLVGSGVGYATGTGETNANLPVSGSFASTSLGHISPEVGYWVAPDLLISAQGRIQLVTGPTELVDASGRIYPPADVALALFLKASLFFGSESFRPFISGGLGGGQIRHVVTFGAYHDCGATRTQTCVDSVVAGPALAQVGAGFLYKLTSTFGIEASSNVQLAEPKFTLNVDLNAGVAFNF